uniref:Exocyst subunit Exo70 family protein n=1 Tax=Solanum tuberosum TaxID=4113 RepID=M1BJ62_SOLTU
MVSHQVKALQTNLDGKSKQYKDPSLTNLFLMNNIHYMVRSVRRSEAKDLLGDDWVQRHRRVVQQHANQYKRIAWAKVLIFLPLPLHYFLSQREETRKKIYTAKFIMLYKDEVKLVIKP